MQLFAWDFELPNLDAAVRDALHEGSNLTSVQRASLISDVEYLQNSFSIHNFFVVATLVIASVFAVLTLNRVFEIKRFGYIPNKNGFSRTHKVEFIIWQILGVDVLAILAGSTMALTYSGAVTSDSEYCTIMWKLGIMFYIMFNHGLYFVMIQRAKAVLNTTLFAQYHKLHKLAWFVEMANYTLFFVYPLPFFTMGYVSLPPSKVCMVYASPAISVFVAIADTSFSMLLLSLFVVPLVSIDKIHTTQTATTTAAHNFNNTDYDAAATAAVDDMSDDKASIKTGATRVRRRSRSRRRRKGAKDVLRRTIRRQCILSALALSSTVVMTMLNTFVNDLAGQPTLDNVASQSWRSWLSVTFHMDLISNVFAVHFICMLWMPEWTRKAMDSRGGGGGGHDGTSRGTYTRNDTAGSAFVTMQDETLAEFAMEMPTASAV